MVISMIEDYIVISFTLYINVIQLIFNLSIESVDDINAIFFSLFLNEKTLNTLYYNR